MRSSGKKPTDEEVNEQIVESEVDGDSQIDCEEFERLVTCKRAEP